MDKQRIINYIDVGCVNPFINPWKKNKQYLKCVLGCEPRYDKNEKSFCSNFSKKINVIEYDCAIFDREGIFSFYVCRKGQCSSLFQPDLHKYIYKSGTRSTNKEKNRRMEVTSITTVKCRRLDSIIDELNINFDFIKIDTQGADHQVIKSLGKYLDDIVGIHTELNFQQFYKKITLFGETNEFLKENGFYLAKTLDRENPYWNNFVYLRKKTSKKQQLRLIKKIYKI